jgi:hypothetical protein
VDPAVGVATTAVDKDSPLDDRGMDVAAAGVVDAPLDDHDVVVVDLGARMAAHAVEPPPLR